ncbi:MAG TPA: glycosyltransferase [Methanosphaera sp.]|nr:glycosyltransferase [Methanosphaera sp.]
MSRILLICHDIPSKTVGATIPIYHLIKELGGKHEITLVSFDSGKYPVEELRDYLKEYQSMKIPEYLDIKDQLKYTVKNMMSIDNLSTRSFLNYYYHENMSKLINKKACEDIDVVITDMPMAFYAKKIRGPKIVYAFDAVSDYNHNMYKKSKSFASRIYWYLNYLKIHNYEKVYNSFDCCILVNEKDRKILEKDIHIPLEVIPNGVDTFYFRNSSPEGEVRLVFLGDMSTPPNNDAVKYFVENIYPEVLKEQSVKFYVVGRNPSAYISTLKDDSNIIVTGSVDDVRKYLTKGSIFVTPMISGTGIKNKILEAMSMELPVISTSCGISGINGENQVHFLLADTPDEFKDNILKLIHDEKLREKIGSEARIFVENNYSWKTSMTKLDDIISNLIT